MKASAKVPAKAVLFDLDGTLADTAPDLGDALNRLLAEEGRPPLPTEEIRKHASFGAAGLVACGFGELADGERRRLTERFLALYAQNLCVRTRLFPGAEKTLGTLAERGIAWGVVTNKSRCFAEPILRKLGLHDAARCLVYGDTAPHKKPAPDLLLLAAKELRLEPADCLYIGDSQRDVIAAKAANMPVLAVAYGYESRDADIAAWGCDGVVNSLSDITKICEIKAPEVP